MIERDDDGRIENDAEIIISNYDEYRDLQRLARIARQLKGAMPMVYDLMEREVSAGVPASLSPQHG